jgi:hypothetical protein
MLYHFFHIFIISEFFKNMNIFILNDTNLNNVLNVKYKIEVLRKIGIFEEFNFFN